jgi:capsular polysaccharide transport system permease protein
MTDGDANEVPKRGQGGPPARRGPGALRADGGGAKPNARALRADFNGKPGLPAVEPAQRNQPARWVERTSEFDFRTIAKRRRSTFFAKFAAFVLLPTLLTTAYVFWYATPRYVSEAQIAYQSNDPTLAAASSGLLATIMGSTSLNMSQVMEAFLTSPALLATLDKEFDLRRHYSDPKVDWLDRMPAGAPAEKFLTYFNRRVSVSQQFGGYLVVDVEAFDPQLAKRVCDAMIRETDRMVSGMMDRARNDAVGLAETELKRTEDRLRNANVEMTKFRNLHGDVNITGSSNTLDTVIGGLESQLSQANSDLIKARSTLVDDSPSVLALKAKIAATEQQIRAERQRLGIVDNASKPASNAGVKPADGNAPTAGDKIPYSQIVADYAGLQTELQFATDSYVSAKKAYDIAEVLAEQKSAYAVSFVPANLPESWTSPNWLIYIPSAFLLSLFAYIAGTLVVGAFRDRAGV